VNAECRGNVWLARPNDGDFGNWNENGVYSRRRLPALPEKENV